MDVKSVVIKVTNNNETVSKFDLNAKLAIPADKNRMSIKTMVAKFFDYQIVDFSINA
ncbi:Ysg (fragment) [Agrobacterium sp. NCPPB 925]